MKIKKMIETLEKFSKFNPDANVKLHGKCGESALFILSAKNDNETVWIESESDTSMKEEISEIFKYIDECDNAIDYYADMLDLGITPKTKVTKVRTAPFGDPIELSVRGYSLTMRLADALLVEVI